MIEMAGFYRDMWAKAIRAKGGFAWWYADLLDPQGNGLVCIWSLGLPFLPDSRRGDPAHQRPSVNLALYRHGRQVLYLLDEHAGDNAVEHLADGAARLGQSSFEIDERNRQLSLRIRLDEPVPGHGSRLRADIELTGASTALAAPQPEASHVWTPRLLHAAGRARVCLDGRTEQFSGIGYFDGNVSAHPLHAQGIDSWRWARLHVQDRTFVIYDVSGRASSTKVLEALPDGSVREWDSRPRFAQGRWSVYGLRSPRRFELDLGAERLIGKVTHTLDDGPFYQRFLVRAAIGRCDALTDSGDSDSVEGVGFYETVYPNRIDLRWQRPFVRMRAHRIGGDNSLWLPLFSGWSDSRGRRLIADVEQRLRRTREPRNQAQPWREHAP